MLTLIFLFILVPILTIVITLITWYGFNREHEKALEAKGVLIEIGNDISKLIKSIKNLIEFLSEVAQPLLGPTAIDVESQDVQDEIKKNEEKKESKQIQGEEKVDRGEISDTQERSLEIKAQKPESEINDDPTASRFLEELIKEEKTVKEEESTNEVDVFTQLVRSQTKLHRLEEAMQEWKSKGNQRLAMACSIAIEELKVKQELLNLWPEEDLPIEEDIAS